MNAEFPIIVRTPKDFLGELSAHELGHAPKALFVQGDEGLLKRGPRVSVIGSRRASEEGKRRCESLVRRLVEHGAVVVSGLALGIDTVAHETALRLGGSTIAVVGTPLDVVYPTESTGLFRRIVSSGAVVSQFPPGMPVQRKNFVLRDHTMALLSDATFIVEGGARSGTEHQGWEAIRLGRQLFVLESVVLSNPWARKLVQHGAQVLTRESLEEVLEGLSDCSSSGIQTAPRTRAAGKG